MKKVSIIIPAYNAHNTLARCLGSVVHQTIQDIEIIIINDASTDDTWQIMQRCEEQFPDKVIIINGKENRGVGGARNQGLDIAQGEYLGFVDSDDFVAVDMYEKMYRVATENDADIVDCGVYYEENDKALLTVGDNVTGELDDSKRSKLIKSGGYLTTKIFKNKLFNDPKVRMRENVRLLEDNDILKYMILSADNIYNVKEVLYNHSDTEDSATKTTELYTYFDSIYGVIEGTYNLCSKLMNYEKCKETIEYTQSRWYLYGINRCIYDKIVEYGADERNVRTYFDKLGNKEIELLSKLAKLRNRVITCEFRNNNEVMNNISELDLQIMEECDLRYRG